MKKLMNIKEVCNLLGIKESKMRYLIFTKKIPYLKVSRAVRFCPEEIKNWLNENRIKEIKE